MKISLIIAFYKNLAALDLIFLALERQSHKNFEVIIAEDDSNTGTRTHIEKLIQKSTLKVKHLSQHEDNGFRKNEMLNKAIKASEGNFLVFLDGDCIPHKHFLKSYARYTEPKLALFARRVMLSKPFTEKVYKSKSLKYLSLSSILFSDCCQKRYAIYTPFLRQSYKLGIFGCNWGIFKKDILDINGFDEDYVTTGVGEDNDIEWRLVENGIKIKSIRYAAIQYHLFHPVNYNNEDTAVGYNLMDKKQKANLVKCLNGLEKL